MPAIESNFFVVFVDSNPQNVLAFFQSETSAQSFAGGIPGAQIEPCVVEEYIRILTSAVVPF